MRAERSSHPNNETYWHIECITQRLLPLARVDIHQHRATSVSYVGDVSASIAAASQILRKNTINTCNEHSVIYPNQPRIDSADKRIVVVKGVANGVDIVVKPSQFDTTEICCDWLRCSVDETT